MSRVKCHHCGKEMALELARARGGICQGFQCPECFRRHSFMAAGAVIGVVVLVTMIRSLSAGNGAAPVTRVPPALGSSSAASYEVDGISTRVSETAGPAFPAAGDSRNDWGNLLFTPVSREKLSSARFGYVPELFASGAKGSMVSETPTSRTVAVTGGANHSFTITQTRAR